MDGRTSIDNDHWRDEGCEFSPRCVDCPLPVCRDEMPPKQAGAMLRWIQIRDLLDGGKTVNEAAAAIGVSRRSVFRLQKHTAGVMRQIEAAL